MPLFLDACALAKRYLLEQGSSRRIKEITSRFDRWGGFVVSGFIEPEVISALARYAREHPNFSAEYLRKHPVVVDLFRKELSQPEFTIVNVDDDVVKRASDLLRRHPEYEIHAGDAVHLATALSVRARLTAEQVLVFVTADRGLEAAAKAEGFVTLNPMWQGVETLQTIPGHLPLIAAASRRHPPHRLTPLPRGANVRISREPQPLPVYMIRIACTCRRCACLARGEAGAVRVRGGAPGG